MRSMKQKKMVLISKTLGERKTTLYQTTTQTVTQILLKCQTATGAGKKKISELLPEVQNYRSSHSEVFLGKGVLKICSKFKGEHPRRSVISINLLATLLKSHFGMGVPL